MELNQNGLNEIIFDLIGSKETKLDHVGSKQTKLVQMKLDEVKKLGQIRIN